MAKKVIIFLYKLKLKKKKKKKKVIHANINRQGHKLYEIKKFHQLLTKEIQRKYYYYREKRKQKSS